MKRLCGSFLAAVALMLSMALAAFGQGEPVQIAKKESDIERKETSEAKKTIAGESKESIPGLPEMLPVGTDAASAKPLSLNEAIKKALENNNDIEVAKNEVRFSEAQLKGLEGLYEPTLNFSPTYSRSSTTGGTASNDFRVDSSISKTLLRGGGNYSVFFNTSQSGSSSRNNQAFNQTSSLGSSSSTTYFSSLGVTYVQPIFRNRAIDSTRRQIKIQKKRLEQSDSDFRQRAILVISQVQQAYWDLVFALRDQQNRLANLNLSRENLRRVEAQIKAGSAAPLARAEVSTELANREGEVLLATESVSQAENRLKLLLLKDPSSEEWSLQFVPTDKPVFSGQPVKLEDVLKDAVDNRPELRRLRLQREINEIDIKFFKNQVKPRIDLNTSFSLNGLSLGSVNTEAATVSLLDPSLSAVNASSFLYSILCPQPPAPRPAACSPIPGITIPGTAAFFSGGTSRSISNLFRSDAPNFSIGVTIQFPLRNKTAKADLAGAEIQKSQIEAQARGQEQTVIAEVRNAVQSLETARQRILTAQRARQNAERQLEGEQKLYEVGKSTAFILFQRENALTNARNAEIRAETDYNKAIAELQRATSTTFNANNIQIDSPFPDK